MDLVIQVALGVVAILVLDIGLMRIAQALQDILNKCLEAREK